MHKNTDSRRLIVGQLVTQINQRISQDERLKAWAKVQMYRSRRQNIISDVRAEIAQEREARRNVLDFSEALPEELLKFLMILDTHAPQTVRESARISISEARDQIERTILGR